MRRGLIILIALGVVAVLVVVGFLLVSWLDRKPVDPPALVDEPGVFRLETARLEQGGQREPYRLSHDGAEVTVSVGNVEDTTASMRISGADGTDLGIKNYEEGDRIEVDGAVLTVLAVHDLRSDDRVDVRLGARR